MFLTDLARIAFTDLSNRIRLQTVVRTVSSSGSNDGNTPGSHSHVADENLVVEYEDVRYGRQHSEVQIKAAQVVLCVNRRLGDLRRITLKDEHIFKGKICYGAGTHVREIDFAGKLVLVIGGGAFAAENARTAIEDGAAGVVVLSRRRGTVMPHMLDYLNFVRPYDKAFAHDATGSARSFEGWKEAFRSCKVAPPECWEEGRLAPSGQSVSVSDLWMIAHYYGLISTRFVHKNCQHMQS